MNSPGLRSAHVPVLPREVLQWLQLVPGLRVLDGTVGAGGHSSLILPAIAPDGILIAMDRDPMMLHIAGERLTRAAVEQTKSGGTSSYHLMPGSYADSESVLTHLNIRNVDRVLLDLGLSSDQLADRERGFGFDTGGPLDMRFDPRTGRTAAELLQTLPLSGLADVFRSYGEEPAAEQIAQEIVTRRQRGEEIRTAEQLEECVHRVVGIRDGPGIRGRKSGNLRFGEYSRNPATRVFQSLRIATNQELEHLDRMLHQVLSQILQPGGIAVILTFHSLEDRIVKHAFKGQHGWQLLTKKPIEASPAEIRLNPRSRSAKLRAIQRL